MKRSALLWFLCTILQYAAAQPTVNLWEDIPFEQISLPRGAEASLPASSYRALKLDFARAEVLLRRAPREESRQAGIPLLLPMPDGTMEAFYVRESPVMEASLAARYPAIKTFLAQGIQRPELNARLDISPLGFHAAVTSPKGLFYIDPLSEGYTEYYTAYYTHHLKYPSGMEVPRCGLNESPFPSLPKLSDAAPGNPSAGTLRSGENQTVVLQTYRLALACTGEYAQSKGGTKATVLASMVSALNRVNQVFEKETAIRLQLIGNNDTLIYLDPATDPYSAPDNASTLLSQNTTALNQAIGAGAYDLGHVFTLGCRNGIGGIANYASACGQNKGAGVTCHFTNNTEFIAIQIMAHELGHQFACGHSWNSCAQYSSQLDLDDAYEPGSGSTIMSYASACGPDNIQGNSDDYYHVGSLEDFYAFSRQYQGKNCATPVPTPNRVPEIKLNYPATFAIPVNTPFELRAQASDADGDPLTYCWEQYDIGPSVPLGEAKLSSPLFRSFRPVESPVRTFPRLASIVGNSRDIREVLPSYSRKMTFRCTVRDNRPGAAGVVWAQVQFQATDQAGPFLVTFPDSAAVRWESGSVQTVSWDVARTNQAPVSCRYVNIRLSTDGGQTFPWLLAENALNTGSAKVSVPVVTSDSARIRVEAADNIFFDLSNQNFQIAPATKAGYTLSVQPYAVPLHCQPKALEFRVNTQSVLGFQGPVTLELAAPLPNGGTWSFSPNPVPAGSSSTLRIQPGNTLRDTLEVVVRAKTTSGPTFEQPVRFATLSNQFDSLRLLSPADGATGIVLSTPLSWSAVPNAGTYNLEMATSPAFGNSSIFSRENITGTSWQPLVLLENNRLYFWRIQPVNACGTAPFLEPFAFHTATTRCKTYESSNVPLNIPGAGTPTIESRINVTESGTLNDVNIPLLKINKEYVRNLRISLVSPKGTQVILYNGHCALTSKLFIGFDDDAPQAVNGTGVCPPDDGIVFRPVDSLARFKGENIQGVWTLRVSIIRNESLSPGAIESWSLEFCSTFQAQQPRLVRNDALGVPPGKTNTLTSANLLAEDASANAEELRYTVLRAPSKGQLKAKGSVLTAGSQFTQAMINAFQLQYSHAGGADKSDDFTFVVENGAGGFIPTRRFTFQMDANAVVDVDEPLPVSGGFRIFPNPANDMVSVEWASPLPEPARLHLFDLRGQLLYQTVLAAGTQQRSLPVGQLPAGLYLLQVQGLGLNYREKIAVQH